MKKSFTLVLVALLAFFSAAAQNVNPEFLAAIRENPFRAGVNTCPYEGGPYADTRAPKGYKPFYISHYGRHGSRSNWDENTYRHLISTLESAEADNLLTADGRTLLDVTRQCLELHNGMAGRLTPRGIREHRGIAERMYSNFTRVFRKGSGSVRVISSTVPRCIISMTAFTDRLTELDPALEISWDTGETYQKYIDPKYPDSYTRPALRALASLERLPVDSAAFASRFFTDPARAFSLIDRFPRFENEVFAVARITASFDIPTDILGMLPEESLYNGWLGSNAYIYLSQANSQESGRLRMEPAGRTVEDIVAKADAVIAGDNTAADLRFGHDFPLVALCSYIGLEGVGQVLPAEEIALKWFGSDYTPFAGNLQLVFYRNNSGGDVLVKFLLNERETLIDGLKPLQGPYYVWNDVKTWLKGRAAGFEAAVREFRESHPEES